MKLTHYLFIVIFLMSFSSCSQTLNLDSKYPPHIGDSKFDANLDDPDFKVCNEDMIFQYYNFGKGLQYKGEKNKIQEHFNQLKTAKTIPEFGFITIRFIVNCEGKTGRFRVQEMDTTYVEKQFNREFTARYLKLTKQLKGWEVGKLEDRVYDYYQYLTFKIDNGKLIEIMP